MDQPTEAEAQENLLRTLGLCPATGAEHQWTDAVGPEHEHLRPAQRWHCDDCHAAPPACNCSPDEPGPCPVHEFDTATTDSRPLTDWNPPLECDNCTRPGAKVELDGYWFCDDLCQQSWARRHENWSLYDGMDDK